jgi:hypothetical protein
MAGERDAVSSDPVRAVRPTVERAIGGLKLNRVEFFDSSLHGYKLLWLEPKVTSVIPKFFEGTIKLKATAPWEPRYNLTPVRYEDIQLVRSVKAKDAPAEKEKAKEKEDKEKDAGPGEAKAKEKEEAAPAKK